MRKLSLTILAASIALIPAAAAAQQRGQGPRPPAGHWRGGGHVGMPARGPNFQVRHRGPNVQFRHGGGFRHRGMHPGRNFRHHRMQRGFTIHPFWFGSQFHVNNWQMYGFGDPGDGRWVRYYDDAYLVGGDGRVRDYRYGMDWDRYGEEWEDDDGVPSYRGRRDADPDDEDDEHAEGHGEGHHGGQGHGQMMHRGHPMPGHGYGGAYGGYYGYGFYAYPIVIETITTQGCGCTTEVVEEVVEVRQRHRRRPPPRPAPPRRPPPGERG